MTVQLKVYLQRQREVVEKALLREMLAPEGPFADHIEAMRYSLLAGGKRLRPILCLAAANTVSDTPQAEVAALPVCCALECIHAYSLIHDDLPAMDNDDLRRGKPTNHIVYGEAQAILAGDGLLTFAFELLSSPAFADDLPPPTRLRIIHAIARAAGSLGMVGGQSLDIRYENTAISKELLSTLHSAKTGALLTASVVSGGIVGGCSEEQEKAFETFGRSIGLAFQITDDLLDLESTTEVLGKPVGSDLAKNKSTFPSLYGIERSRELAREAIATAHHALRLFDQRAEPLRILADYILDREN
ncbi:MAG: farnesyl-diphosphate synthase [Desulfobulbus propionicus]|nr:MAG: farnesyl-diphosphate synthase [Desulfobulbus propionicus]